MATFIEVDNLSNRGKAMISFHVFDQLVTHALESLPDVSCSTSKLSKKEKIRLNKSVKTTFRHGIAHVWVNVDIKKGVNIQEASELIQQSVINTFLTQAEQIPFDVQVKVESLI